MVANIEQRRLTKDITAGALTLACAASTASATSLYRNHIFHVNGFYGGSKDIDPVESEKVLRSALDSGMTLLNTADAYTGFEPGDEVSGNIKLIGKVMKDYPRESVVVAMKWGGWIEPGVGFTPMDISPKACKDRVDKALKILGTDYIDVLTLRLGSGPDANGVPLVETAKGMKEVLESGKVKAIGISEVTMEEARTIQAHCPVSAIETEWNLFNRESEEELIPWARSIGAGIMAYSPMARGLLTGKLDKGSLPEGDFRRTGFSEQFNDENFGKNAKLVHAVEDLARAKSCTAGQLALAWVLAQGKDVIPIPGTKRLKYLEENIKSLDVKLTEEEISKLSNAIPRDQISGRR